ncbi:hypothetical protein FRC11_006365 [Ceratobasidium sp. 423]|nr:hypothetical protein FRC11_006365 [Ceratobasidium sp. 423]
MLQAPKTNDLNAQDLAKHVEGLLGVLNTAILYLDGSAIAKGVYGEMLIELHQLQARLSDTYTKLQDLQASSYTTKLASQTEIRERILQLKEELSRTIVDLTLRLLILVLASGAQTQLTVVRRLNSMGRGHNALARDHDALARQHHALQRASQRRQRISDKRIRGLTHRVNAVLLMRQTDEQRIAHFVLLNGVSFFFRP